MLDYEWDSNPSTLILSAHDDRTHDPADPNHPDPTRPISFFDPTIQSHHSYNDHRLITSFSNQQFTIFSQPNHSFYDPRTSYQPPDSIYHHPSSLSVSVSATPPSSAFFSFDQTGSGSGSASGSAPASYYVLPKTEIDVSRPLDFTSNRIGLNLGGRTYFSAADDDFVSRLYRRSRPGESGVGNALSTPRCQAEGCNADLSHAKHYHRRHKVCEFHSKASTVVAAGLTQRFCQQCSRFHLLSEFDNGKRSCRKRLADHNRRRRKCHQSASVIHDIGSNKASPKSASESGVKSVSPPNLLLSPTTISLECFRQRQFQTTASSATSASSSSNSMFFSSG